VQIAAADPLNLVGIVTAGARVSPYAGTVLSYRDGVPMDGSAGEFSGAGA
jgi:hypothetical protein